MSRELKGVVEGEYLDDQRMKVQYQNTKWAGGNKMMKSATLSPCMKYRYSLSRVWNYDKPIYGFIGVNPSTADAIKDDPTVKKWIGFTERWDGGGFHVCNAFGYRATDVNELKTVEDPIGEDNMVFVENIMDQCDIIVPCWGNKTKVPKVLWNQFDVIHSLLDQYSHKPIMCFGTNKSGCPKHPAYLSYEKTPLVEYKHA